MALHKNIGFGDAHVPYSFEYADQTAREGDTSLTTDDIGKFARQLDDNTLYMLVDTTPTWVDVGNTAAQQQQNKVQIKSRKATAGTISKGEAVRIVGYNTSANVAEIEKAKADSSSTMPVWGVSNATITESQTGDVMIVGEVSGLDTSAFSAGQQVFVSAATAGAVVGTAPSGPSLTQSVAIVERVDASAGILAVITDGVEPLSDSNPQSLGSASPGTLNKASREDHVHPHGTGHAGGAQHAAATTSANGFMPSGDKTKVDLISEGTARKFTELDTGVTNSNCLPRVNNDMAAMKFEEATNNVDGVWRFVLPFPKNYTSGDILVKAWFTIINSPGPNDDSIWEMGYAFRSVGDGLGSYTLVNLTKDMSGESIDVLGELSFTIPSANVDDTKDELFLRLKRVFTDAGDWGNPMYVHALFIEFTGWRLAGAPLV